MVGGASDGVGGASNGVEGASDGVGGPVMYTCNSLPCHAPFTPQADLSHLFLSSSFDWTVRLWSMKPQNEQQLTV